VESLGCFEGPDPKPYKVNEVIPVEARARTEVLPGAIRAAELELACYNTCEEALKHRRWRGEGKVKLCSRHERFYV